MRRGLPSWLRVRTGERRRPGDVHLHPRGGSGREVSVGLALLLLLHRRFQTLDADAGSARCGDNMLSLLWLIPGRSVEDIWSIAVLR